MNYLKTIFIATILLSINPILSGQYEAYTQEPPINLEEVLKSAESTATATPQEEAQTKTETSASATAGWNDHLASLAEKGQHWDVTSNIPTNSWKTDAFTLAKEALTKDKSLAETIKSAFFDAITAKIKQEGGEFTASTYALIKEFDDAIDAHIKIITETEAAKTVIPEETKPEPVTETIPAPVETTPAPTPAEEEKINQPEATSASLAETPRDIIQEWNSLLEDIIKEGTNLEENTTLLQKAYTIARELFVKKPGSADTIKSNLENAIIEHNENLLLEPIDIKQAMAAFSEATGIKQPLYAQGSSQQQGKITEQNLNIQKLQKEMAAKEAEREREAKKFMAAQVALSEHHKHELSEKTREMEFKFQQKLAQMKVETRKEIKKFTQNIQQIAITQQPTAEKGIIASILDWWYGARKTQTEVQTLQQQQEEFFNKMANTQAAPEDQEKIKRSLKIIQDILVILVTPSFWDQQSTMSQQNWTALMQGKIDIVKNNLNILVNQYQLMTISDACALVTKILTSSSRIMPEQRIKIINEIKDFLEKPAREALKKEQEKKNLQEQKTQEREQKKELAILEQQKIKNEKKRIKIEKKKQLSIIEDFKNEKQQWEQFLTKLSLDAHATEEKNNKYTAEAIQKAQLLLNHVKLIPSENIDLLEQILKQEFTRALVSQPKVNEHEINIQPNIAHFNKAIHEMTK